LDAEHLAGIRVAAEDAVRRAELVQFAVREKTLVREDGIEREAAVALAQYAAVALFPLWVLRIEAEHVVVEHAEDFDERVGGADVAAARVLQHAHTDPPKVFRALIESRACAHWSSSPAARHAVYCLQDLEW